MAKSHIGVVEGVAIGVNVPFVRSAYNYDRDAVSDETGLRCLDVSLAQQHMKDECDINTIVDRFGLGYTPPMNLRVPIQADFVGVTDYQESVNRILAAQASFALLPAAARARFQNNPAAFVEFASIPENRAELSAYGLTTPHVEGPLTQEGVRKAFSDALAAQALDKRREPPTPDLGPSRAP